MRYPLAALLVVLVSCWRIALGEAPPIPLYAADHPANAGENPAPDAASDQPIKIIRVVVDPEILPYLPSKPAANRAAVVICPGGGYSVLAIEHEGTAVAKWFAERGIAAFVCKYRCGGGKNGYPVPQSDAQRAIRIVRARAGEWNIDPDQIGIMGFPAGGHLAASVATLGEAEQLDANDPIDTASSVPNFCIDIYGVMSMMPSESHGGSRNNLLGPDPDPALCERLTPPRQVNESSPPMFIMHAADDQAVPISDALALATACTKHGVPVELHITPGGGHGFGIQGGTAGSYRQWPAWLESWMVDRQLMDEK